MFGRGKRGAKKRQSDSSTPSQYWTRKPGALDALSGRLPDPGPVEDEAKGKVYPDEIDPEWADPDTAK